MGACRACVPLALAVLVACAAPPAEPPPAEPPPPAPTPLPAPPTAGTWLGSRNIWAAAGSSDRLFVVDATETGFLLDGDGGVRWTATIAHSRGSRLALDGGRRYLVRTATGEAYAIDDNGDLDELSPPVPGFGAVAAGGDRLYVTSGEELHVWAEDGTRSRVVREGTPIRVLAADGSRVVWADGGRVVAALHGEAPVTIATGQSKVMGIAVRGDVVAWSTWSGAIRVRRGTAGVEELASDAVRPGPVAAGSDVCWAEQRDPKLMTGPIRCSTAGIVVEDAGEVVDLLLLGGRVVWRTATDRALRWADLREAPPAAP
jgi:hypothetical protein